jgi:prepilin signal peptidase PulO-like enzyme (type II secretory pathway)
MLVELATGLAFAGLYVWEVHYLALYALMGNPAPPAPPAAGMLAANFMAVVHAQYFAHILLLSLMIMASLIDLDEQTIPDAITIPGTLSGLALATAYPWSLLPAEIRLVGNRWAVEFLTLTSPRPWPAELSGLPRVWPLLMGLGCWTLWCGGIMPRRWNTRRGWIMAARVFWHRLWVERITYLIAVMWLVGAAVITLVAWGAPTVHWAALLTALVGMAAAGGIIWIVRVIGAATLRREAMGFGDVMLMSMIGTFIGWQGALVVFFVAPFFALVNGLVQWTLHRGHEIPYGPYLCLASVFVILKWAAVWDWGYDIFAMGDVLAVLLAVCFAMMAGMLWVYRILRERITGSK